jgi:preprotein translocase subunit YajC
MIAFIVIFVFIMFITIHFVELSIERKYERRNEEMLNNIKKQDEKERKK